MGPDDLVTGLTFDAATAVEPAGDGAYSVDLRHEYAIGGTRPNGGYVLACLGRAALAAARDSGSTHRHVLAAGAQYSASPALGPNRIDTKVVRVGNTATQVTASVAEDGAPGVEARFTLGTLADDAAPYWGGVDPVVLPPLAECHVSPFTGDRGISVSFDPATSFAWRADGVVVTGEGEFRAWLRDEDDDVVDPVTLLFAADCLPPATAGIVFNGWVPTLDLTVYLRTVPVPGPLRLRFRVQMIQDGFADEICEAWDSADRLVMQSTQLVALRHPSGPG